MAIFIVLFDIIMHFYASLKYTFQKASFVLSHYFNWFILTLIKPTPYELFDFLIKMTRTEY